MLHPIIIGEPPLEMECCQLAKLWGPGVEAPRTESQAVLWQLHACFPTWAVGRIPRATSGLSMSAAMTGGRGPSRLAAPSHSLYRQGQGPSHPILSSAHPATLIHHSSGPRSRWAGGSPRP